MIYAKLCPTYRIAEYELRKYAREHFDDIEKVSKVKLMVLKKNGDEIHFVPEISLERWELGRRNVEFTEL